MSEHKIGHCILQVGTAGYKTAPFASLSLQELQQPRKTEAISLPSMAERALNQRVEHV